MEGEMDEVCPMVMLFYGQTESAVLYIRKHAYKHYRYRSEQTLLSVLAK
jgi:hypothetical protein